MESVYNHLSDFYETNVRLSQWYVSSVKLMMSNCSPVCPFEALLGGDKPNRIQMICGSSPGPAKKGLEILLAYYSAGASLTPAYYK